MSLGNWTNYESESAKLGAGRGDLFEMNDFTPTRRVLSKYHEGPVEVVDIEETTPKWLPDGTLVHEVRVVRQRIIR